ncbi:MAG: hypothetical protein IH845_01780 [Nanoarchaeota archaeon]|nr:hypothetical protein [Nanoarchaeota archaeon]
MGNLISKLVIAYHNFKCRNISLEDIDRCKKDEGIPEKIEQTGDYRLIKHFTVDLGGNPLIRIEVEKWGEIKSDTGEDGYSVTFIPYRTFIHEYNSKGFHERTTSDIGIYNL